jgi:hypothetical protein
MKVILLGAGASKAYGASPTGQRMPIARDFFPTFLELTISENPWVLMEGLIGFLRHEKGIADVLCYLSNGVDIEALHSEIEAMRDDRLRGGGGMLDAYYSFRAFNELVFLFAAAINEIQNGPVSDAHLRLVERLGPDDAIITFNWDTLADRALAESTDWVPDWGYGPRPRQVFRDGWRNPVPRPALIKAPELVKLHGSTNWITAYPVPDEQTGKFVVSHDLAPSEFNVFVEATGPYPCWAGRYMEGYGPYAYGYYPPNLDFPGRPAPEGYTLVSMRLKPPWKPEGSASDEGLTSIPLIIPPVKHKSYEMFGDLFRRLWRRAEDLLAAADNITVIGYSFPPTDVQSDRLFRAAFSRRSSMPQVHIIDPAPKRAADKFRHDLGISDVNVKVQQEYFTAELATQL